MMTVHWSPRADETYGEILEYLPELLDKLKLRYDKQDTK